MNRFTALNLHLINPSLNMKKFIVFSAILALLISCGNSKRGELVGVQGKKWYPEKPYGMTLVPGGAFIMGKAEDDFANVQDAPTKTVTVRSFYMDETEITNSEYRQFVEWVKDSIIRTKLAVLAEEIGQNTAAGGKGGSIGDFAFKDNDPAKMSAYDKYMYENYNSIGTDEDPYAGRSLNRKPKLLTDVQKYPDEYYVEVMDTMYLKPSESYNGLRTIDARKLKFQYAEANLYEAVKKKGRKEFYKKKEAIEIYPDTTVWIKDFNYSYNEPMHNDYFWHQAYGDYPVVGVSWKQTKAFCAWRTMVKNQERKKSKKPQVNSFRLPTEAEWEYAARGGLESAAYPWGGPYAKNDRGCYLANFKPNRGDYAADGALYTLEAKSFEPNGYNLYNMSGNVAEWTNTSYDAIAYEFTSTMNPNVPDDKNMRKVIRGGSWKDVGYYLQVSTRDFEYADSARSYIGFRTVQDYMGTKITKNQLK